MATTTPTKIVRAGALHVRHYTGDRPTGRITYRGVVELSDGSRVKCPHDLHRTVDAATRCARTTAIAR